MKYSDKLKDPRWQKKRLEILNRDKFTCRLCFNEKKTLHVHHLMYDGQAPWETPRASLMTLCEDCHSDIHSGVLYPVMANVCSKLMKDNNINTLEDLDVIVNGICMGQRAIIVREDNG